MMPTSRLSPHVRLVRSGSRASIVDRRTSDRYPISTAEYALLRAIEDSRATAATPGTYQGTLSQIRRIARIERLRALGALVADNDWAPPGQGPFEPSAAGAMFGVSAAPGERSRGKRAALAGLPWDFRFGMAGAALGPQVLRTVSRLWAHGAAPDAGRVAGWHSYRCGLDILVGAEMVDCGDIRGPRIADYELLRTPIEAAVRAIRHSGVFPVFVGGDHGLTLSLVRAMSAERIAVVHLDAHDDFADGPQWNHGTFMRRVAAIDNVASIHMAGLRGIAPAGRGAELRAARVRVLPAHEWTDRTVQGFVEALPQLPVYVSLDVDVLDPACAPGTRTLRGDGVSPTQVIDLLQRLARRHEILAFDIMELARPRHSYDQTPHLIVEILVHLLHEVLAPASSTRPGRQDQDGHLRRNEPDGEDADPSRATSSRSSRAR